jgi:hypothetical protein
VVRTTDPRRPVALAILAIAVLGACGAPSASGGAVASPKVSCVGVPVVKCDEAVASVARSLPNTQPVAIDVSCVSETCTPQSGAMDTVVTLADGSTLRSNTLSWADPNAGSDGGVAATEPPQPAAPEPAVPVQPACQGVPPSMCATMAETAFGELPIDSVVSIVVRCTKPPCTNQGGAGDTTVSYADGSIRTSNWEYAGD